VAVYEATLAALHGEHGGRGPALADLGANDPGGPRSFDPSGVELRLGDARAILPTLAADSIDFVATDPPYNVQLPMTMAGGRLAEAHANRRTGYAMVSELDGDLANLPDYAAFLDAMGEVLAGVHRVLRPGRYAVLIVRDAYQGGRYLFTAADLAARADAAGLVPKGDIAWYQAGTRLRPYGYPNAFVPNIAHQHIVVLRKAPARGRPSTRAKAGQYPDSLDAGASPTALARLTSAVLTQREGRGSVARPPPSAQQDRRWGLLDPACGVLNAASASRAAELE
jgi:hypothetical protein